MQLYTINTGFFKLDGGAMFGVVPKSLWQKINPADENNLVRLALRCLLIEDGNRLILIDTGIGNKQDARFFAHYYLHGTDTLQQSLAQHGFSTDDVTDVVFTHLHFDHCGGAIFRNQEHQLVPVFKNAHFWSNERHWKWATKNPNEREKASFLPENILPIEASGRLRHIEVGKKNWDVVGDNLLLLNKPSGITSAINIRLASGHTEAMMLPQVVYKGKTIVFMADLLPTVGHIPLPYIMSYDMQALVTLQEKKSFLKEALENDYILFFQHDPIFECCTLQMTNKGIREKETFQLKDL